MPGTVEFRWKRSNGEGDQLRLVAKPEYHERQQRPGVATVAATYSATLMRVATGHAYNIEVVGLNGGASTSLLNTTATAGRSGLVTIEGRSLDDEPVCIVEGSDPTFDVVVFDHSANGTVILGCDKTGWLVWYLHPGRAAPNPAQDQWSAWGVVVQLPGAPVGNVAILLVTALEPTTLEVAEFTATGSFVRRVRSPCSVTRGASMTHELALGNNGDLLILQSVSRAGLLPLPQNAAVLTRLPNGLRGLAADVGTTDVAGGSKGGVVAPVSTREGLFVPVADVLRLVDPKTFRGNMSDWGGIPFSCGANGSSPPGAQDWSHPNAAALSADGECNALDIRPPSHQKKTKKKHTHTHEISITFLHVPCLASQSHHVYGLSANVPGDVNCSAALDYRLIATRSLSPPTITFFVLSFFLVFFVLQGSLI